jgi:hypothetical protein
MALSPQAMKAVDSLLEKLSRKIWSLPTSFQRAGLHAPVEKIGLSIASIWEDFYGSALRSSTKICSDEGALGFTARESLQVAASKFRHLPFGLAFYSSNGGLPLCPSLVARNVATLLTVDLHPTGGSGNPVREPDFDHH